MATELFVILPDCLYYTQTAINRLKQYQEINLVEDPKFFNTTNKSKLIMLRSAMKQYYEYLKQTLLANLDLLNTTHVPALVYINHSCIKNKGPTVFDYYIGIKTQLHMWDPSHNYGPATKYTYAGITPKFIQSESFLLDPNSLNNKQTPTKAIGSIMKQLASTLNITNCTELINKCIYGKPEYYKTRKLTIEISERTQKWESANDYVTRTFKTPKQKLEVLPTSRQEALELLSTFIKNILPTYHKDDLIVLAPSLNIGLITPRELIDNIIQAKLLLPPLLLYDIAARENIIRASKDITALADSKFNQVLDKEKIKDLSIDNTIKYCVANSISLANLISYLCEYSYIYEWEAQGRILLSM